MPCELPTARIARPTGESCQLGAARPLLRATEDADVLSPSRQEGLIPQWDPDRLLDRKRADVQIQPYRLRTIP